MTPGARLRVTALLVASSLLWGCYLPKTPTPRLGQTAAPDATSQAQGTQPEGVQPGVPVVPPSPTLLPSFPTPGTPGVASTPAPPTPTPGGPPTPTARYP